MSDKEPFVSTLGPAIARYLALKKSLGRGYAVEETVLCSLDVDLTTADYSSQADLTAETFRLWCHKQEHLTSGVRRNRMRIVRNFCLYRRRTEPECWVPDLSLFPGIHQPVKPYIFTEKEIQQLLNAANLLEDTPLSPLRAENFYLAIVLLYTTGLRRGELLRMTVGDFDAQNCTLLVRVSKFHKSRFLPLSPDGVCKVKSYLQMRYDRNLPVLPEEPLLWNRYGGGRAYTGTGLSDGIRGLLRTTGIQKPNGQLPRIHDFRHTFAVHALLRWYREGTDLHSKLPLLATYMGHISIVSTQHYLHFIEQLATSASDRFAQHCGALVTAPTGGDDI